MCGKTPFVRLAAAHHAPFFCKICASAITLMPKNFTRITSRKYPREEFFRFPPTRRTNFRTPNCSPPTRGTIFVHRIASRQPAERISYTKLLPANSRNEFRTQNCSPPTRGTNFVHKIASRQRAERISYTKLLPANPRNDFRTQNCFPPTRGTNFRTPNCSPPTRGTGFRTPNCSPTVGFVQKKSFFGFPRLVWRKRILLLSNPR